MANAEKILATSGLASLAVGWATVLVSIALNPWFNVLQGALSDMGAVGRPYAWVFNGGLMASGVLLALYSLWFIFYGRDGLEAACGGVLLVDGIHLFLIGLYPEGTEPHLWVSLEFFLLIPLAMILEGASLARRRLRGLAVISLGLALGGLALEALLAWPSIATRELFAVACMSVWVAALTRYQLAATA